jgi:hypothetical protein
MPVCRFRIRAASNDASDKGAGVNPEPRLVSTGACRLRMNQKSTVKKCSGGRMHHVAAKELLDAARGETVIE